VRSDDAEARAMPTFFSEIRTMQAVRRYGHSKKRIKSANFRHVAAVVATT
jgi:hypothetical protein